MSDKPISLHGFKNFISRQKDLTDFFDLGLGNEPAESHVGQPVRPRVDEVKLLSRIDTDGDPEALVKEFCKKGGVVLGIDERKIEIETASGSFVLPRFCVKIKRQE